MRSSQVEQVELFAKIRRGINGADISETWIILWLRWKVDTERRTSEFDAGYYGKLLENAWDEVTFVRQRNLHN
jgi:hypothetical protein